eukprot:gene39843-49242_t
MADINSNNGRSMKNEALIITALNKLGAHATLCCLFKQMTLSEQLNYAYHADVIIGIHGAGLMNAGIARSGVIVVELKTLYGYKTDLFAVVTSSIPNGMHIQINVASYATQGGSKSIDKPLPHILGPYASRAKQDCASLLPVLNTYWILIDADFTQYCASCGKN